MAEPGAESKEKPLPPLTRLKKEGDASPQSRRREEALAKREENLARLSQEQQEGTCTGAFAVTEAARPGALVATEPARPSTGNRIVRKRLVPPRGLPGKVAEGDAVGVPAQGLAPRPGSSMGLYGRPKRQQLREVETAATADAPPPEAAATAAAPLLPEATATGFAQQHQAQAQVGVRPSTTTGFARPKAFAIAPPSDHAAGAPRLASAFGLAGLAPDSAVASSPTAASDTRTVATSSFFARPEKAAARQKAAAEAAKKAQVDAAEAEEAKKMASATADRAASAVALANALGRAAPAEVSSKPKNASLKFSFHDVKDEEIYCVRFSPDDSLLAVSYGNGTVGINNTLTGRHTFNLNPKRGEGLTLPITGMCWRPVPASLGKELMVSVASDGGVTLWNATARKRLHDVVEEGNQLFCVDYSADASQFATAGKENVIRLYDEASMKVVRELSGGDGTHAAGHSNRVFSVKFHPIQTNLILTGSWDKKIEFWDTRVGFSVRSIHGPLVGGDSLDISGDGELIVTGAARREKQLQLWDFRSGNLLTTLPWLDETGKKDSPCMLYTTQFSKNKTSAFKKGSLMLAAGGSQPDQMKLWDLSTQRVIHEVPDLKGGCFSLDFSSDSDMIAVASGDGKVQVFLLEHKGL